MTFSQFAQALYPYCNEGASKIEFVRHLADKIMDGQPGRLHSDGTYQNPLRSAPDRNVLNYFNGDRTMPADIASAIYASIRTEKFEEYIDRRCSLEAQINLFNDLSEIEPMPEKIVIPQICATLFYNILKELAEK